MMPVLRRSYSFGEGFSRDTVCYACACLYADTDSGRDEMEASMPGGRESFCEHFDDRQGDTIIFGYLATFIVVIVNQIVKQILVHIVNLEKNHTIGSEQSSVALKVYFAQLFKCDPPPTCLVSRSRLFPCTGTILGPMFHSVRIYSTMQNVFVS